VEQFTIATGWSGHGKWIGDGPRPEEEPSEWARCTGPGMASVSCVLCTEDQEIYRTGVFHISEILSVVTRKFIGRDFDKIQCLLERVTGHGVPHDRWESVAGPVADELVQLLPWLRDLEVPQLNSKQDCEVWVTTVAERHGEWHLVVAAGGTTG
jgi:hypothetical protein